MGVRLIGAKAFSAVSTWGLKNIFKRPAANFPGKIALYIDPQIVADLAFKLQKGSVVVCGTNGKTTVNNLFADVLQAAGQSVICNRTGANLDSGVATALLHSSQSDWGSFECDEMWISEVLSRLGATYLLLLNLFHDQLDRVGEVKAVQDSIIKALKTSPTTTLVYNADDPCCQAIADAVENASVSFGLNEPVENAQSGQVDAPMCQKCANILEYSYHQYDQLGKYQCPICSFCRADLDFSAQDLQLGSKGLSFAVIHEDREIQRVAAPYRGAYMIYNLLAVATLSYITGCSQEAFIRALAAFNPHNGRMELLEIHGNSVFLNLAKNPTGFNQNLVLIGQDSSPKTVVFSVNDQEGDGRDVSWLWDINFESLCNAKDLQIYAGGSRKNDLQLRLKYAGLSAELIDHSGEVYAKALSGEIRNYYFIANYTALPPVRAELVALIEDKQQNIKGLSTKEAQQ